MPRVHGEYQLQLLDHGQILLVTFSGAWNRPAIEQFYQVIKNPQLGLAARWVALADLRPWQGGPPDLLDDYQPFIDWCIDHGEIATAQVVATNLQRHIVSALAAYRAQRIPQATFAELEPALAWARQQLALQRG